jgi:hypothetical protein
MFARLSWGDVMSGIAAERMVAKDLSLDFVVPVLLAWCYRRQGRGRKRGCLSGCYMPVLS